MKVLVVGAAGQLGADLVRCLEGHEMVVPPHADLDVADRSAVERAVLDARPDVVLNASAYNHVDRAEEEPEMAIRTNALGPRALAIACTEVGALLVHFSTDYVFAGTSDTPYREEDAPFPRSVYGTSKLMGEFLVREFAAHHMILRTSGLYGLHGRGGKGGNFVETMLRLSAERPELRVVDDQILTPTSTADLAAKTVELVARWQENPVPDLLGLYHVTNRGRCSWFEFAGEILTRSDRTTRLIPVSTAAYGAPARRPAFSVLAHGHLARLGMDDLPDWKAALARYLAAREATPRPS